MLASIIHLPVILVHEFNEEECNTEVSERRALGTKVIQRRSVALQGVTPRIY